MYNLKDISEQILLETLKDISEQILLETRLGMTPIRQTTQKVVEVLKEYNIPCELIGGYAVHLYGFSRFTDDTDFIVSQREQAKEILTGNGFKAIPGNNMTVVDKQTGVSVDLLEQGKKDSKNSLPYPNIENHVNILGIPTINLFELIELKLGTYLAAGIKRLQDKTDVTKLIIIQKLPGNFLDQSKYPNVIVEYKQIWKELNSTI
jgi:hypothetical protein